MNNNTKEKYTYVVLVLVDATPALCEEDITYAVNELGYYNVLVTKEVSKISRFDILSNTRLPILPLKDEIEALDDDMRLCHVEIELVGGY